MARYYGKTRERGYGWEHAQLRKQWKPRVQAGQVACCAVICLEVMDGRPRLIAPGAPWHLGHTEDRTAWTGPEHQRCGAADGARRGNRQQPRSLVMLKAGSPVCQGCGQPYHYAARACEMCGAHYHPSYGEQRTCGRACGRELQQRNKRVTGWLPKAERPKPPRKLRKPGPVQSGDREPKNGWPSSRLQHYTCRYCGKQCIAKASAQPREVCPATLCQAQRLNDNRQRNDGRHRPDWFGTSRAW